MTEYYATARRQFESETTEHALTVLHDDGLYRHLRCAQPGTGMWAWQIVTWPGYLTICGDIGSGFTFYRLDDMFEFFHWTGEPFRINPGYWAEKLPRSIKYQDFSEEMFAEVTRRQAKDYAERSIDDEASLARFNAEVEELIESPFEYLSDESAHEAVRTFTFDGKRVFSDTWEWEFTDYTHDFLLACFAICWAIEKYKAAKAVAS